MLKVRADQLIIDSSFNVAEISCARCGCLSGDSKCCSKCETCFCGDCQQQFLQTGATCFCGSSVQAMSSSSKLADNFIKSKLFRCSYYVEGCKTVCNYQSLSEHQRNCFFQLKQCENEGCDAKLPSFLMYQHVKKCPLAKVCCKHCMAYVRKEAADRHLEACPRKTVACPGCHFDVANEFLRAHQDACPKVTFKCQFCNITFARGDFEQHTKDECLVRSIKMERFKFEKETNALMENLGKLLSKLDEYLASSMTRRCSWCSRLSCDGEFRKCGRCRKGYCRGCQERRFAAPEERHCRECRRPVDEFC